MTEFDNWRMTEESEWVRDGLEQVDAPLSLDEMVRPYVSLLLDEMEGLYFENSRLKRQNEAMVRFIAKGAAGPL